MRRPHARVVPKPLLIPGSSPGEAFIPGGTPYLGQAVLGELIRHSNVLFPDRRHL